MGLPGDILQASCREVDAMPKAESVNVTLPTEVIAMARSAVERGLYSSIDEVVSDAISHWTPREEDVEWLRQAWQESLDDPGPGEPMEAVMDRLEAKYRALYAGNEAKKCA
jgi:Arc/MetJ-type ribon-helix-helix transcriptional regulator